MIGSWNIFEAKFEKTPKLVQYKSYPLALTIGSERIIFSGSSLQQKEEWISAINDSIKKKYEHPVKSLDRPASATEEANKKLLIPPKTYSVPNFSFANSARKSRDSIPEPDSSSTSNSLRESLNTNRSSIRNLERASNTEIVSNTNREGISESPNDALGRGRFKNLKKDETGTPETSSECQTPSRREKPKHFVTDLSKYVKY